MERSNIVERLMLEAQSKLREAEVAWYAYASVLPVGPERVAAFQVFENIRLAQSEY